MIRFNRYLVFYVILAVGLAVAWTQVGRRAQLSPSADLHIMDVEADCRVKVRPCAAYAGQFALVLGPSPSGQGLLLVGESLSSDAQVQVQQLDKHLRDLPPPAVQSAGEDRWVVNSSEQPGRLRVTLSSGDDQWVAEFPLQ